MVGVETCPVRNKLELGSFLNPFLKSGLNLNLPLGPDILDDHLPLEVEFHELESEEVRIVGASPAEVSQLQLSSVDEVDDGAETLLANLLHQHLVLAVLLHVATLITMNYEMRTEIQK